MRYSGVFLALAFVCVLPRVSGRPDLGLNAPVNGTVLAVEKASLASMLLNLLDDYSFVLGADYPLLESMTNALSTIGAALADKGSIMANGVALFADDDSGTVVPAFDDVLAGITELLALIDAKFPDEYQTLQYRDKTYITDMIDDNLDYFSATLNRIKSILNALQPAVEEAQSNAGGDGMPVSIGLIRRFIAARTINALLNAIAVLPGAVSPFLYSVDSTLANQDQADTYILTVRSDITELLLQAHMEVIQFNGQLRQLKTDTVDVISNVVMYFQEQQPQIADLLPVLQAASTFDDDLAGALVSFDRTVSPSSITEKTALLEEQVANYISIAKTFDDDLVTLYGDRICEPIISVAEVLVASGPYAIYCYQKFSPKVPDLASHHYYDIGECYELELNRIYSLHRLIVDLVDMVSFNYGELFDDFALCFEEAPCPGEACDACVDTLGEVLDTLSRLADEKFDLILQVIPTELDASLQRLKSCVAFAKYKLIADAHDLITDVYDCETTGYN